MRISPRQPDTTGATDRIFARYLEWIQDCNEAIHTLRLCIKQARAYRERCCAVLGAALGAALALEQAVYSGSLHTGKAQELQRLCASVTAAIELAQQRVQVYGRQSRIKKVASLSKHTAIQAKFTQVTEHLDNLTKQVWALQTSEAPESQPSLRVHVNAKPEAAKTQVLSNNLLTRNRLRRGCHCHTVHSVLYVGHMQGRNDSANTSGQIWWSLGSPTSSKMFVHDVATASISEIHSLREPRAVLCMQVDGHGYVWLGFREGLVEVWDAQQQSCLCHDAVMQPSDIRVLASDPDNVSMWAGTEGGVISQLRLIAQKVDSRITYKVVMVHTLQLASATEGTPESWMSAVPNPAAAQVPRTASQPRLAVSSSASSYCGTDQAQPGLPDLHPPGGSFSDGEVPLGALHAESFPMQARGQPLLPDPILGNPTGLTNSMSPAQTTTQLPAHTAALPQRQPSGQLHATALPQQQPSGQLPPTGLGLRQASGRLHAPGLAQRQLSGRLQATALARRRSAGQLHQVGTTQPNTPGLTQAPALDQRQAFGQFPSHEQGHFHRQSFVRRTGSAGSNLGALVPASLSQQRSLEGPVHAVAVVGSHVFTSTGLHAQAMFREWSAEGHLLAAHQSCSLGHVTCISEVPTLVQCVPSIATQRGSTLSASSQKLAAQKTGQLLTGHVSGQMKLWSTSQQSPVQALAVIRAVSNSPVRSLVILTDLSLICSAHSDGQLVLQQVPAESRRQSLPVPQEGAATLPLVLLLSSSIQAHKSGLQQCVAGYTGLVTVGAFGSVMAWPEAELRSLAFHDRSCVPGSESQYAPQLLERFFTPRSAMAVEKALGQMTQQVAKEKAAQGHSVSPVLAAMQRGDVLSSNAAPVALTELMQHLSLAHADSNDLAQPPEAPPAWVGSPRGAVPPAQAQLWNSSAQEATPFGPALPDCSHLDPPSQCPRPGWQSLMRGPSTAFVPSLRQSQETNHSRVSTPAYSQRDVHELAQLQGYELQYAQQLAQQQQQQQWQQPLVGTQSPSAVLEQQPMQGFERDADALRQYAHRRSHELARIISGSQAAQRPGLSPLAAVPYSTDGSQLQMHGRVSWNNRMELPTAAVRDYHADLNPAELNQIGGVAKAGPPPPSDHTRADLTLQDHAIPSTSQLSAFYQSSKLPLPRTRSSASDYSGSHFSGPGSVHETSPPGSVHRAASQLMRAHTRSSDPLSALDSPRQGSATQPESQPNVGELLQNAQPISQRATGDSLSSQQSSTIRSKPSTDLGSHEPHVVAAGSGQSSVGGGSLAHSRKSSIIGVVPTLERASMSAIQMQQAPAVPLMPRSESHKNLRQGLDKIPSGLSAIQDPPALSGAVHNMRRTASKLSLETLAAIESMSCTIIEYSQLELKRKIGDGSIGQVYLGKWQETDVAVKVLAEMHNLSPQDGTHPQDPCTQESWAGGGEGSKTRVRQGGVKAARVAGLKVIDDMDSHGWGSDDDSSIGVNSQAGAQPDEHAETLRTLEREVSIMAALRHPNVVMFMGLCLEPPCIVTEFCARGSLYDVLKKARTSPAFAQQLDWSKRLTMALDAAKGVFQLHSHKPPILHRDLKSPNMLVDRHWRCKITDFNLSRMVKSGSNNASVTSLLANNPRWLAPEVVCKHDYSKAADVYSFGIVLWEMMTWRLPWEDLNPFQIMMVLTQQSSRPEIPPLEHLPGQPLTGIADYLQLMQECWSEDPSKRPRFEDIIISLRGLLEGANSKQKLQKTLTAVPRLSTTCTVPPRLNKLTVVGQTPFGGPGPDPQHTPTPLDCEAKPGPLQMYETDKPFFGSTPVGGLDIVTVGPESSNGKPSDRTAVGKDAMPGGLSQPDLLQGQRRKPPTRRHTFGGTATAFADVFETAPSMLSMKTIAVGQAVLPASHRIAVRLDSASKRGRSLDMPAMTADGQYAIPAWLQAQRDLLAVSSGSSMGLQTGIEPGTSMLSSSGVPSSNLNQRPAGTADVRAPLQLRPQAAAALSATGMSHDGSHGADMIPYSSGVNTAPIAGSGPQTTNANIIAYSAGMNIASGAGPSNTTTGSLKGSAVSSSHGSSCELAGMVSPFAAGPPSSRELVSGPMAASEAQLQTSAFAAGPPSSRDLLTGPVAASEAQPQQLSPFAAAPACVPSRDADTDHSHSLAAAQGQQQQPGASTEQEGLACSGSLVRNRSGSFGGRGAALGHMMEAHQQWRQDSFSRAQEARRSIDGIQRKSVGRSPAASTRPQGSSQQGQSQSGHLPRLVLEPARQRQADNSSASNLQQLLYRQQQGQAGTLLQEEHIMQSSARPAGVQITNDRDRQSSGRGVAPHIAGLVQSERRGEEGQCLQPVQAAAPPASAFVNPFFAASQGWHPSEADAAPAQAAAAPASAFVNPFLAASQGWQPSEADAAPAQAAAVPPSGVVNPFLAASLQQRPFSEDDDSSVPEASGSSNASLSEPMSEAKVDSSAALAAAERWLLANSASVSDNDSSSDPQPTEADSPSSASGTSDQSGSCINISWQRHQDASTSQASCTQGRRRQGSARGGAKAGPPPDKGTFRNSPAGSPDNKVWQDLAAEPSGTGPVFTSYSPFKAAASRSTSYGSIDTDRSSSRSLHCPSSRKPSFAGYNARGRLDTIQSDSSAEAQAQYSAKSSNASAGSLQLSNATAIVDSVLTESVSGSDPYSGRLPSLVLAQELEELPFQTRLQTVIEGLEQSNSPGGSVKAGIERKTVQQGGYGFDAVMATSQVQTRVTDRQQP